ncbi:MAG: IS3 family transposase [Verrucomicrobia bacterium]|nr:MAG: IS3 family transposase [Verrucomicrobiota bacterium]
MIDDIRRTTGHGIRPICEALGVPRSSYYHGAEPTATECSDRQIGGQIEAIFKRHRRRYGHRRIWRELADRGIACAPSRVRRIMAERGLKAIQPKTFVPRTSDGRADKPSPNLLEGKALPDCPDRVWAGDITFIPTAAGWLYLAVVIDLCTRRIVGWSLARHMRAGLVSAALKQALETRRPGAGLVFHSDRGSQYGSGEYREMLARAGAVQSMSARANPYHNAWTESFMGTLKAEMLQGGCFDDEHDARTEIFDFIEAYYNTHRKHSSLGYLTPAKFEADLNTTN